MSDYVDATFYAQVQPEWGYWDNSEVVGAKVVGLTQKKPDKPRGGTVLTKLTIRIPTAAFKPLVPEAIVVVPESLTQVTPIEVEAVDPS